MFGVWCLMFDVLVFGISCVMVSVRCLMFDG